MKLDEKALEAAAQAVCPGTLWRSYIPEARAAIEAYLASLPVGAGEPVAVKPLEWKNHSDGIVYAQSSSGLRYRLQNIKDYGWCNSAAGMGNLGPFDSLDAAKISAQSDYEARIRSALAPVSLPTEEEIVVTMSDISRIISRLLIFELSDEEAYRAVLALLSGAKT